jgi:2-hydroxychromene-2-carboxylate isomerase
MDLARWAGRYGLALNPSNMRENDGDACSRAVLAAEPEQQSDVTLVLYRAMWSEGKTLATSRDVVAALTAAGIETTAIAAGIDAPAAAAQLDANTDEAVARGVFGSPTIFVGNTMFFGNDRLDFVREEIARQETAT